MEIWSQVMETGATPPVGKWREHIQRQSLERPANVPGQTYTQYCTAYLRRSFSIGVTVQPTYSVP
jgi:hypothetical protein